MKVFWYCLHAIWYGLSHPFSTWEQRDEYAMRRADKYMSK